MAISIEKLPPYEQITCAPIREAAANLDAARAALSQAKRDVKQLEQERPHAEWRDAEAAEQARAEGKSEPKRSCVVAHDRKLDQARHEEKIATLAAERARKELVAARERHGDAWGDEVDQACSELVEQWSAKLAELGTLYGELAQAFVVRRTVFGGEGPRLGAIGVEQRQIGGLEFAMGQRGQVGWVQVPDVLGLLADIGTPDQVVEETAVQR